MKQYTTFPSVRHAPDIQAALTKHERLVQWVVRRQWLGQLSYAEALHAGRMGLWRALQRYDPGRGTAFSTYAVPAITRAVWRAVAQAQPDPQELLTAQPPQVAGDPESCAEDSLVREALTRLVIALPERLCAVVVARYGLAGDAPQTFAAIAQTLGVTRQRVQQLHIEALLWLAHPARSLRLRQLLDRNTVADYQAYLAHLRRWLRSRRRSEHAKRRSER